MRKERAFCRQLLGPMLPGFLSPNAAKVIVEKFGIAGIGTVDSDIEMFMAQQE